MLRTTDGWRRNGRLVSTLAMCIGLVGCGGGDGNETASASDTTVATTPTTTSAAPATTVATTLTTGGGLTTTSVVTGARVGITTTVPPPAAATPIDRSLMPEGSATFQPLTMNGVAYPNAMRIFGMSRPAYVEINAGRSRQQFLGSLSIPDNERSSSVYQIDISLDGAAPVYSSVVAFGETKEIVLDITGVLRIRVTFSSQSGVNGYFGIGNPRFT